MEAVHELVSRTVWLKHKIPSRKNGELVLQTPNHKKSGVLGVTEGVFIFLIFKGTLFSKAIKGKNPNDHQQSGQGNCCTLLQWNST